MKNVNGLPGLYIVFDGIVGCGKSEQIKQLEKHFSDDFPGLKYTPTYEPGGNPEADKIRLRLKYETMSPIEEVELFSKSRGITIPQVVVPVLSEGGIVFSDRCFSTSLAYQAFGRGVGLNNVWQKNKNAVDGIFPDMIYYLKVGLEASLKRSAGDNPDKFDKEARSFWERTIPGFDEALRFIKELSPETKIITIDDPDGKMSIEDVRLEIKRTLYPHIAEWRMGSEGSIRRER